MPEPRGERLQNKEYMNFSGRDSSEESDSSDESVSSEEWDSFESQGKKFVNMGFFNSKLE
jgi:hypothetical protein